MTTVPVRVRGAAYDVAIGVGLLARAGEVLPSFTGAERAFVVAAQPVAERFLGTLGASLELPAVHLAVPEGEEAKTLRTAEALWEHLATQGAHRADPVMALGGGSTGDVAGFVAATYMRGVPFVQLPTTLTAQVDAAIGGKVGVNLPRGKNLVGAFHQPAAVLADVSTLATLPEEEFRSGLGEAAKYGLAVDPWVLDVLERRHGAVLARDPGALADLVAACVRAKASVVEADERDTGARSVLNYGHTLAHALERLEGYGRVSHGEAVAMGMAFAARLSVTLGIGSEDLPARHRRVLASLGLPKSFPELDPDEVLEAMHLDKKYRQGIRFVLLEEVGRPRLVEVRPEAIRESLSEALGGVA
ncbi:MAG TPA: 3-dehydroquinate synthase [Actinomycetota bacterium]